MNSYYRSMTDRIKGSNIPFINLSNENLTLIYNALEAEQAGKMLFALKQYVCDGIEPSFDTKIENSVWVNVLQVIDRKADGYFKKAAANRENGKKGGRPKKNNDITPNEEFEEKPEISPNKPLKPINDIEIPQEVESVLNGQEMAKNEEFEIQEETYDYSDKTYEFIDNNKEFFKGRINTILESMMNPQDKDREYWSNKAYDNIKEYLVVNGFREETVVHKEVLDYVENKVSQLVFYGEDR